MSTLFLPDVMDMIKSPIFYTTSNQNWRQEWPGNEASCSIPCVKEEPAPEPLTDEVKAAV